MTLLPKGYSLPFSYLRFCMTIMTCTNSFSGCIERDAWVLWLTQFNTYYN